MRSRLLLLSALVLAALPAEASRSHRHPRHASRRLPVESAPPPVEPGGALGAIGGVPLLGSLFAPLTGPSAASFVPSPGAGRPIPPEAARFMGYPYDVPGYRYEGYDGCLLRVGGVFGPGPSAAPCPLGLGRILGG